MSTPADLVAGIQAFVAGLADTATDPSDRVRLLAEVAATPAGEDATLSAVFRRAALSGMARAAADSLPRSYDDAVALRDLVCGAIRDEERVAADAGEGEVTAALRALRGAVDRDLTRRGANLSPLRTVTIGASLPSLAVAQRLYGDAGREPEVVRGAGDPPNPLFMPEGFRALAR